MNIKWEPIKIEIKDVRRYGDIAYIFDKQTVINEIVNMREVWELRRLVARSKFLRWSEAMIKQGEYQIFWDHVNMLRLKLNLLPDFSRPLETAIVCGVVTDFDYRPVSWIPIDNDGDVGMPTRFALYFNVDTTRKELLDTFQDFKKQVTMVRKIRPDDRFYLQYGDKKKDTVSEIKKYRDWYWQKIQGKTYLQIANADINRGGIDIDDYKEAIRKGIKQYQKRLSE